MCGIAGIFSQDPKVAETAIPAMNASQAHRGPDDEGVEFFRVPGGGLALGQRRLSILDLSAAGHQPMSNRQTQDWIVFNGEIYNFRQLRQELESHGARFSSNSDTEVILKAFAHWGCDCFDRLHGMFAIALYHAREQQLILTRDPLGIKPLYYAQTPSAFVFASEVRAILSSGLVPGDIDRRALASLMAYGAVPTPLTLLKNVRSLEPGAWASLDLANKDSFTSNLKVQRYWDFPEPLEITDRNEALEETRSRLEAAGRSHLISDVPVGVFLSSGLDSTAVATLSAQAGSDPINTFTVGLAEHPEIDENPEAEETARLLNGKHHAVLLTDLEIQRQAQQWMTSLDQPSVDGLNTYIVSGAVRERGIKVALSGLGGDEVFGGYSGFRDIPALVKWAQWGRVLPRTLRGALAKLACARKSKSQRQKAIELAQTRPTIQNILLRRRRLFSDFELESFGFEIDTLDLNEDYLPSESEPDRGLNGLDPESAIGVLETRFYMGNMLLRDSDVCGMAHGLEIRVPFLDRQLTDYVLGLPGEWRVKKEGINKPLLVDSLGKRLRPELVNLKKRGFSLPQAHWMAGPLREQFAHLLDVTSKANLVNSTAISTVWRDFLDDPEGPTWSRAWLLGVIGAWLETNSPGRCG